MSHRTLAFAGIVFALLLITIARQAEAQASQITWAEDPQLALTLAQGAGIPIVAYATSDHCGYCRKMERETWSHPAIIEQVEADFVPLRIDAKRDAGMIAHLKVRAYPTTLVIAPEGRVLAVAPGFLEPGRLAGLLRGVRPAETMAQAATPQR